VDGSGFLDFPEVMRRWWQVARHLARPVPDAADSDAEVVVGHGAGAREVHVVVNFQGVVRSGRLSRAVAHLVQCA